VLRVDLSRERASVEELSEEDVEFFIGGSGLAAAIIYREVDPKVDPLSEANKVVCMTGPLTGTIVPGGNRTTIAAKSPLTGAWGEGHLGGFWGPELKFAGYDGVIVEGRASSPVYILIRDDEVEVRGAERLWGLTTSSAERAIRRECGDEGVRVLSIGPAGERLVRYAVVVSDERVAGRTGMGAVFGSKNLKAIAVRGTGKVRVKEYERLRALIRRLYPAIMSDPTSQVRALYGTNGEMEVFHEYGDVPIRNFTLGEWPGVSKISGQAIVGRMLRRHRTCFSCPIHCWKEVEIEEGPHAGTVTRAPEYETAASLGALLMIDDPNYLATAEYLCNEYGIDVISAGVTIAWATEAFERGLLTEGDTDGLRLRWGDPEVVLELIERISRREGFGDLLAEGCRRASEAIGRGSEELAMHVKGVEVPMHDPRAFKGMGLQYATSNRGADHLQGTFFRIEQGERVPDLGIHERVDRFTTRGKAWMVAVMQDWHEVLDSVGLCKFVGIAPGHVAAFYTLVTGIVKRVPDLREAGERIFNLKRMFNVEAGISREDDTLPKRFLREPLKEGGARGQVVELDVMLEEYYRHRGWDERGVPTPETLARLRLAGIVRSASRPGAH